MPRKCAVNDCNSGCNARLHNFPSDLERCKQWANLIGREDLLLKSKSQLNHYAVCSSHFQVEDYNCPTQINDSKLKWTAKPSLNLSEITNEITKASVCKGVQCQPDPVIKALKQKIYNLERKLARRDSLLLYHKNVISELNKKLQKKSTLDLNTIPQKVRPLVANLMKGGTDKRHRWTAEDLEFGLCIFNCSPKTYRLLRQWLPLPCPSTLRNATNHLFRNPGFCPEVLQMLAAMVENLDSQSKCVSLALDGMSIQPHLAYVEYDDYIKGFEELDCSHNSSGNVADQTVVFSVRGLFSKWKMEIGFFHIRHSFKSCHLTRLMKMALNHLAHVGLKVKIIVMDQESTQRMVVFKLLACSLDKPFFYHNGSKILVAFDPPHLMKNTRNNLKKYDIETPDGILKWKHLLNLFNIDQSSGEKGLKLCPRLTSAHLFIHLGRKMNVRLAAQLISNSVAAGLEELVHLGKLPLEALQSSAVIRKINMAFDMVNSSSFSSGPKSVIYAHLLQSKLEEIQSLRIWISKWSFLSDNKETRMLPVKEGWLFTLRSFEILAQDLILHEGFQWFATRRVNQDHLENLFSQIRARNGYNDTPTSIQVQSALRRIAMQKILGCTGTSRRKRKVDFRSDCFLITKRKKQESVSVENAFTAGPSNLETLRDISNLNSRTIRSRGAKDVAVEGLFSTFQSNLPQSDSSALQYIGGWIVDKIQSSCETCKKALESRSNESHFLKVKRYQYARDDALTSISSHLADILNRWESEFRKKIKLVVWHRGISNQICKLMWMFYSPPSCCTDHPDLYKTVLKSFVKLRLHAYCRFYNRKIKDDRCSLMKKHKKLSII